MLHEQEIATRTELSSGGGIQGNWEWAVWATELELALSALENYRPQQPEDELRTAFYPQGGQEPCWLGLGPVTKLGTAAPALLPSSSKNIHTPSGKGPEGT